MSKLSELMGQSETITVGPIELDIKPLSFDDLQLFVIDDKAPSKEQMNVIKKMIAFVLKKSVPDATDEEINNISVEHFSTLMEAISRINKLTVPNVPSGIKK